MLNKARTGKKIGNLKNFRRKNIKISELSEIKQSEAKVQMKKNKNHVLEANEGDPQFIKQLATTLRP